MPEDTTSTNAAEQLTHLQLQFIRSLRGAPQNAVPFSGPYGTQGVEAPGYSSGIQQESFEDPSYKQKLYDWEQEARRTAEATRAEQAIQAGIRFIYQRRYDEDLKRGVPEQQAFSKMMLGIAMHGPKTDPIKAFEAFRARPAPTAQMMKFGTNEVPGVVNVDRSGAQRWTPLPASALPQTPGQIITQRDPTSGRLMQWRNGQWYPVDAAPRPPGTSPLESAEKRTQTKAYDEAAAVLREEGRKRKTNSKANIQATKDFQSASNALFRLGTKQVPTAPEDGSVGAKTEQNPTSSFTPKNQADVNLLIDKANKAIAEGKDPVAVRKWLESKGIKLKE